MKYTDIVKRNTVQMISVKSKFATYQISYEGILYQFDVPLDDIGTGVLKVNDNAMLYARWIRKAIDDKVFIKIS